MHRRVPLLSNLRSSICCCNGWTIPGLMTLSKLLTKCGNVPVVEHNALRSSAQEAYDVVIVGAGMVGAALAAAIGASPFTNQLKVALVDHQVPDTGPTLLPTPTARVSTIVPSSIQLIRQVGAWDAIAPPRSASFNAMQVWDSIGLGFIRWNANEIGLQDMGVVVENHVLQAALLQAAQQQHTADKMHTYWPAGVTGLELPSYSSGGEQPTPLAKLQLKDGTCLAARLVVGADGSNSHLRALAGFRTTGWSYRQKGLVATIATAEPSRTAWQCFLPTGPLALLPLRDGMMNIVWSTTLEMAAQLEQMPPAEFGEAVNRALNFDGGTLSSSGSPAASPLGQLAGIVSQVLPRASDPFQQPPRVLKWVGSRPASFPLQLKYTGRYVRPRFALLGDAAHAVHPLAGQGVNLGMGDAQVLAEALRFGVERGMDLGSQLLLQDYYETPRQRSNTTMMAVLDGLQKMFSLQAQPLALLRSCGVGLLNLSGPIKSQMMKYAMGV